MARRHKRSKEWGYALEIAFLARLSSIFERLKRRGSLGYYKDAPDLVQEKPEKGDAINVARPIRIVATKDKGRTKPYLVTLSTEDLLRIVTFRDFLNDFPVVVQVKGREESTTGNLYLALEEATK